ncbi:hypothetical protein B0H11DRAFT_2266548 [Mycena galericulata]|nr:hypothetical protein B0H11DRAFT_2266548 [Mycena galericulata]
MRTKRATRHLGSADNPVLVDENGRVVPTLIELLFPRPPRPALRAPPASPPRRIRIPRGTRLARDGYRVPRNVPLEDRHLYLDANIKSHPVNYPCGHGHCYVCARKWLERSFDCPICRARITHAPVRNFDTEAAIAYDHPEWIDRSLINFSWGGLIFPTIAT